MSLLATVQRGRAAKPPRILVHGTEGIGKSTFGSQAPKPVFIQTEDGLDEIDCSRFPLATTYDAVVSALGELRIQQHDFESVVIDSLDWLERLIWDKLCALNGVDSIEKVDGGLCPLGREAGVTTRVAMPQSLWHLINLCADQISHSIWRSGEY